MSILQLLRTTFRNLKMKEDETIIEFNVHLHAIANNSFSLSEKVSEKMLTRKILRYFLTRFDMKVTSIEEE